MKIILARTMLGKIIAASFVFGVAESNVLLAQTYNFSAPTLADTEVDYSDPSTGVVIRPFPGDDLGFVNLGTMNGSFIYDPNANTVRVVGTVPITGPTSFLGGWSEIQTVNGVAVPLSITINSSVANAPNGVISYDSGIVKQQGQYPFIPFYGMHFDVAMAGTYSVVTGGQTYDGTFNYTLGLSASLYIESTTSRTLTFDWYTPLEDVFSGGLTNFVVADGADINLTTVEHSDGATYAAWKMGYVTGQVPEHLGVTVPSFAIVGLLAGHRLFKRFGKAKN